MDTAGNVTGTVTATGWALAPAVGFWNELAQQLTLWVTTPTAPSSVVFRGCLFVDTMRISGVSGAVLYSLAGFYEGPPGLMGSAHQNVFGWYAQIGVD